MRLFERRGRLRGRYRTISGPLTDPKDEVVIWVAEEREYQEALEEARAADGARLVLGGPRRLAVTRWEMFFMGAAPIGLGAFIIWAYNASGPIPLGW